MTILFYLFQESKVLYHIIGLKCGHCGSYNTCRVRDPDAPDSGEYQLPGSMYVSTKYLSVSSLLTLNTQQEDFLKK